MNWKKIALILLILMLLGAVVVYFILNKPHADYENMKADYALTSSAIFDELNENDSAISKYRGKVIELNGEIVEIKKSADSAYILLLKADNAITGGINAKLSNKYINNDSDVIKLKVGDMINLKCRFQGFEKDLITEVKLDNCFIVN